jgi:hypothetical protein
MKKVRMIVSATVVFAVVGGALAFKTPARNLFQCIQNQCLAVQFSDVNGTQQVDPAPFYKSNTNPNFDCPNPTNPAVGCAIKPVRAFVNQ